MFPKQKQMKGSLIMCGLWGQNLPPTSSTILGDDISVYHMGLLKELNEFVYMKCLR